MRIRFRTLLLVAVAAVAAGPAGCGAKKDESKPNPEFEVPDIPAAKRDSPGPDKK